MLIPHLTDLVEMLDYSPSDSIEFLWAENIIGTQFDWL